jgi:hypothetical protein
MVKSSTIVHIHGTSTWKCLKCGSILTNGSGSIFLFCPKCGKDGADIG